MTEAKPETQERLLHVVGKILSWDGQQDAVAVICVSDQPAGTDALSYNQVLSIEAMMEKEAGGEEAGVKRARLMSWTWLRGEPAA